MIGGRTRASWALLALGLCVTLVSMLYAGPTGGLAGYLRLAPFALWAALPYPVYAFAAWRMAVSPAASRVLLLASSLLVAITSGLLYQTFVAAPDAQGGLVYLFLPLWQLLGLLPFVLVALRLRARS